MLTILGVIGLVPLFLILYMVYLAFHDHVRYDKITHEKLPASFHGFQILFIADIHRRKLRSQTFDSITDTPDIVCIGGDLIERGVPFTRMRENIRMLKQWGAPVYFVWGNNDYETQPNEMIRILKEEEVMILEDDVHVLTKGNEKINLLGFDFYYDYFSEPFLIDWSHIDESFTMLLTHKPSSFTMLEEQKKKMIDLVLAGHTHGGQIRIFGWGPFTKGGISHYKRSVLLTTEGYGYSLVPLRLGTRSECHLVTLYARTEKG